jgi:hypothetical protein
MASWRPAKCLPVLRDEINKAYPNRNKAQDGIIGNAEHASRKSDHNPDSKGVVHAIDIDARGIPAGLIVAALHKLALSGDPRMVGGYLIWNGQIASHTHAWHWRDYTGADPHNLHFHFSCTYEPACDSTDPWHVVPTDTEESDMFDTPDRDKLNALETLAREQSAALRDMQKAIAEIRDKINTAPAGNAANAPASGKYTFEPT